ncbi:MAG: pilus assembly protein TadG-related protein [Burkholderiales bacterium]
MKKQSGSVTLTLMTVLMVLLAFIAMALDLSRLYLARGTLQTAADAAALAGARQLDNTVTGTLNAVLEAQAVLSRYHLALEQNAPIDPGQATFRLGPCANANSATSALRGGSVSALHWSPQSSECTFVGATSNSVNTGVVDASGLQYLEVDTGTQSALSPYFAQAFNLLGMASPASLTPFGYAVAGYVSPTPPLLYR